MSKGVSVLPKGMMAGSALGGAAALVVYVLLQLVCAALIDREVVGVELLYPLVCGAAAAASFAGCMVSALWRRERSALSACAVVTVFLALTLAAALLTADAVAVDSGLAGVGLGMAAGGLLAAVTAPGKKRGRERRKRTAQRRRGA